MSLFVTLPVFRNIYDSQRQVNTKNIRMCATLSAAEKFTLGKPPVGTKNKVVIAPLYIKDSQNQVLLSNNSFISGIVH